MIDYRVSHGSATPSLGLVHLETLSHMYYFFIYFLNSFVVYPCAFCKFPFNSYIVCGCLISIDDVNPNLI